MSLAFTIILAIIATTEWWVGARRRVGGLFDTIRAVPVIAVSLALATTVSSVATITWRTCARRIRAWGWVRRLLDTWWAVPVITVSFALASLSVVPTITAIGRLGSWRRAGWFWDTRWTVPVITMGLTLPRLSIIIIVVIIVTTIIWWFGPGRGVCRLRHTRRAVPMVAVGFTLAIIR
jgi:hypothetical protein